ncbi:MAG: hypothetical protein F6K24_44990 [Okeania sp. SIO2D1]|nr:hypothetical protein [Okeania sp. SIO2D1]
MAEKESAIVPVSEETRDLVEEKMPNESDEIKQKLGELIDVIKKQAEEEIQATGEMTRETYVDAISQAQDTLKKVEDFFSEQQNSLEENLKNLSNEATKEWESFTAEVKEMGDRLDRAVNAAWKILTEEDKNS